MPKNIRYKKDGYVALKETMPSLSAVKCSFKTNASRRTPSRSRSRKEEDKKLVEKKQNLAEIIPLRHRMNLS
jgi:hypothetical protein